MTSLEKRLFHLFDRSDIKKARLIDSVKISCPRVGQVLAILNDDSGPQEVLLELTAGRRGGMTLFQPLRPNRQTLRPVGRGDTGGRS